MSNRRPLYDIPERPAGRQSVSAAASVSAPSNQRQRAGAKTSYSSSSSSSSSASSGSVRSGLGFPGLLKLTQSDKDMEEFRSAVFGDKSSSSSSSRVKLVDYSSSSSSSSESDSESESESAQPPRPDLSRAKPKVPGAPRKPLFNIRRHTAVAFTRRQLDFGERRKAGYETQLDDQEEQEPQQQPAQVYQQRPPARLVHAMRIEVRQPGAGMWVSRDGNSIVISLEPKSE